MACTHVSFSPGCPDCAAAEAATLRPRAGSEPSREPSRDSAAPFAQRDGGAELARGTVVGRYVILHTVAQGGMGRVYAAYDPELDRKVAIKLLLPGAETSVEEGRSRLLREAQAMARLSHPNVVPVHDVGVHEGSVFMAMEYVEGVTLKAWMRKPLKPWREALQVLISAGRGLAAAHAAGLVHRDFKPANVLIGEDGRARVTDFGLVRAVERAPRPAPAPPPPRGEEPLRANLATLDTQLTQAGVMMGTPGYMPPEQLSGEAVTPRTDQFAFCVTCYQALYGEPPFQLLSLSQYTSEVVAGKVRPPPPGSKVPGWVRKILVRGLSADPAARFPSMDAVLEALGKDPAAGRRRWLAAGAVAVVGLAAAVTVHQLGRAQSQLCSGSPRRLEGVWDAAARASGEKAFDATGRPFAKVAWARASAELDRYSAAWTTMHREACEATRVRGEQPESVLALRMTCLEGRLKALGAVARSFTSADAKVVEQALHAASALPPLETCADLAALRQPVPPPADAAGRAKLEVAQQQLAEVRALKETGRYKRAMELIAPLTTLSADVGFRPTEAEALLLRGQIQRMLGDPAAAEDSLVAAVAAADEGRSDDIKARALASLVGLLGYNRGQYPEARRLARLAEGAIARAGGDELLRAELDTRLADVEWRAGALRSAIGRYEEALALRRKHQPPDHPEIAHLIYSVGWTLMDLGDLDGAAEHIGRSREVMVRLYGEEHPLTIEVTNALEALALSRDDVAQARALSDRLMQLLERSVGKEAPRYGMALLNNASVLMAEGKPAEALKSAEEGARLVRAAYGPDSPDFATSEGIRADTLNALKRYGEALAACRRGLEILEKMQPDGEEVGDIRVTMSKALGGLGRHDEAIAAVRRTLPAKDEPGTEARLAKRLPALARAYRAAGRYSEAVSAADQLLKLRERGRTNPLELAEARFELAQALWGAAKDRKRAIQLATEAREVYATAKRTGPTAEIDRWLTGRR